MIRRATIIAIAVLPLAAGCRRETSRHNAPIADEVATPVERPDAAADGAPSSISSTLTWRSP